MKTEITQDELEFEKRKKKIESFKTELKTLMDKYNFGFDYSDNYNGLEEYCGTDYYLIVDGVIWYNETIVEIFNEFID